jgi:REP element-mobilizing transposase RayT
MSLVVLADETPPPSLDAIRPWTLVRKPFQLDGLLKSINLMAAQPADESDLQGLPWLNDVSKAAQHLTRLTLASSAQAALITRSKALWAYAGGLSQNAAQELARIVTRSWDTQRSSDLLRFVRLDSTRAEHMLFATRLAGDAVLALVFDAETPFSTIRSQANDLISHISEADSVPGVAADEAATVQFGPGDWDSDENASMPPISDILSDIPSPDPAGTSSPEEERRLEWPLHDDSLQPLPGETRTSEPLSNAAVFSTHDQAEPGQQAETGRRQRARRARVEVDAQPKPERPLPEAATSDESLTRLSPATEAARKVALEPVSAGLYHLTYACLLVPRFASHYLTGDVSDRLSEWLPTICVAFGWRLEFLAVRPEYLQWVVNVQPNTAPGYVMRVMREQTSEKIFHAFPRKARENPSGDFWAPGYLIMGGSQPHPPQLVRDYIRQVRERQGQESRQRS